VGSPLLEVTGRFLAEQNTWEHHDGKEPLWDYVRAVLTVTLKQGRKAPVRHVLESVETALYQLGEDWMSVQGIDSNEEGRTDFHMAYQRAKCPAGKDPLAMAWDRAQEEPRGFSHEFCSEGFGQFLDLAFYLQEYAGSKTPIAIPVDGVGL